MPVRAVLHYPNALLKRPAEPAVDSDPASRRGLARDLVDTMRASPATVGLAAPQIGELVRSFVLDVSGHPRATSSHGPVVLFDPELEVLDDEGAEVLREGCLSVPDLTANVRRSGRIVVRATGLDTEPLTLEMEGFEARAAQHELDHLDGLLILDRVRHAGDVFPRRVYR